MGWKQLITTEHTGAFAITGSNVFIGNQGITGSLNVSNLIIGNLIGSSSLNLITASSSGNVLTFEKGDGSTFTVTINTSSGSTTTSTPNTLAVFGPLGNLTGSSTFRIHNENPLTGSSLFAGINNSFTSNYSQSFVLGNNNVIRNQNGIIIGNNNEYGSTNGLIIGENNNADDMDSILIVGKSSSVNNSPNQSSSILLGEGLLSSASGQVIVGRYNLPDNVNNNDTIFVIGKGRNGAARSDSAVFQQDKITFFSPLAVTEFGATGSLLGTSSANVVSASVSSNLINFYKGDGSTFNLTVNTGSTHYVTYIANVQTYDNTSDARLLPIAGNDTSVQGPTSDSASTQIVAPFDGRFVKTTLLFDINPGSTTVSTRINGNTNSGSSVTISNPGTTFNDYNVSESFKKGDVLGVLVDPTNNPTGVNNRDITATIVIKYNTST